MNIDKVSEFISDLDHPRKEFLQILFYWLIGYANGKENAVKMKSLEKLFSAGIQEWKIRDLRRFIVDNLPIASTPQGLFYPVSKSDLEAFEHHIKSRIFTMWKRLKCVSEAYPELTKEGQLDLFEYEKMREEVTK